MSRSGLWAERGEARLFVGAGEHSEVLSLAEKWHAAGWTVSVQRGVSSRRKLRPPYEPAFCPVCGWAGVNLATHHARAHPGTPPASAGASDTVRAQARAARATQDRNRRPRAGLLVVEEITFDEVRVYRIVRVNGKGAVTLSPLPGETNAASTFTLPEDEVIRRFRPVGRWVRR